MEYRRWHGAINKISAEAKRLLNWFPEICAIDYSHLVVGNIMRQKHMGSYAPYNTRYAAWKVKYGRAGGGYWRLMGDLVKNITHFKVSTLVMGDVSWMGGIPFGVTDTGGKSWFGRGDRGKAKSIAMYGHVMEWGGYYPGAGYHPPRPIFAPSLNEYIHYGLRERTREVVKSLIGKWL